MNFGISKKIDGQMKLQENGSSFNNRKIFFNSLNINIKNVVSTELAHGVLVERVNEKDAGKIFKATDGLITNVKDICLTVTVSDCLPIFFYDYKNKAIGIAHAGWRGVVGGIVNVLLKKMKDEFGSDLNEIEIYIGPHIKKCHFEIKNDIVGEFKDYSEFLIYRDKKIFVNLEEIVRMQLIKAGAGEENIKISLDCTYCNEDFFSYRRDKPDLVVSQIAYITLS